MIETKKSYHPLLTQLSAAAAISFLCFSSAEKIESTTATELLTRSQSSITSGENATLIHANGTKIIGSPFDYTVLAWNPQAVFNVPEWNFLCKCNPDGNYQNPWNCNQFIMCASGTAYVWSCPAGGWYAPIPDLCSYAQPLSIAADTCPWRSIWQTKPKPTCATIGQRLFWSPLTLPQNPEQRCGKKIVFCKKYKQIGKVQVCPFNSCYSKIYLGCLPCLLCNILDGSFGL